MVKLFNRKFVRLCLLWETSKLRGWMDTLLLSFFKEAWEIIATDVTKAIKERFTNGVLLKELNHTILALITKVTSPMKINDYRPISCCNIMYKCISRVISNRMKGSLVDLVSLNQSAFVPGRRISDIILWTQCIIMTWIEVDIQKAYDTVDWKFLHDVPIGFGFHPRMIGMARVSGPFTYHQYSYKLNLINICFVDDLFLFAHGDVDSAKVIMDTLEEFKEALGLTSSLPKSTAYFCNVLNYIKLDILNIIPFEERKLSVVYLGVLLVPSRLLYRDCKELMEMVKGRISDWKNMSKYSDLGTIGVSHLADVNNKLVWKDLSNVDVRPEINRNMSGVYSLRRMFKACIMPNWMS
nr:hypothetical protein [Tanacetum cinerariifolium]